MTKLCLNLTERYVIIWRGEHHGAYYWITPASVARLLRLTNGPLWRRTHRTEQEHYLEETTL